MELTEYARTPGTQLSGHQTGIEVAAGQSLVIETSPGGGEVLDVECPTGKVWSVRVIVEITETDA